jgi:hypothetical protein
MYSAYLRMPMLSVTSVREKLNSFLNFIKTLKTKLLQNPTGGIKKQKFKNQM